MNKLKRFISSTLLTIMLVSIILPLFKIEVQAAGTTYITSPSYIADAKYLSEFTYGTQSLGAQLQRPGTNLSTSYLTIPITLNIEKGSENTGKYLGWNSSGVSSTEYDENSFNNIRTIDTDESGYYNFFNILKSLSVGGKQNVLASIGDIKSEDLLSKFKEEMGYSEISDVDLTNKIIPVYSCFYDWNPQDDSAKTYIGCDFDVDKLTYVYYVITVARDSMTEDDFLMSIFMYNNFIAPANKSFYIFEEKESERKTVELGDTNFEFTPNSKYSDNIVKVAEHLIMDGDTNLITSLFSGQSLTNEQWIRISRFNQILNYDNSGEEGYVRSNAMLVAIPTQDCQDANFHTVNIVGKNDSSVSEHGFLKYESKFDINDGLIAWGDLNEATGTSGFKVEGQSDETMSIARLCGDIISYAVNVDVTDATGTTSKVLSQLSSHNNGDGTFLYELLETFSGKLDNAIAQQNVFQNAMDGDKLNLSESSSNFDILNNILIYSVKCIVDDSEMLKECYLGERTLEISTNSTGKNNSNGVTDSIYSLYNSLSDYQKAVLSVSYYSKVNELNAVNHKSTLKFIYDKGKSVLSNAKSTYSIDNFDMTKVDGLPENTKSLVEKYSTDDLINTGSVTNVARNAHVLTKYCIATSLYGNSEDLTKEDNIFAVYNENLEALIKPQWTYDDGQRDYFSLMPEYMKLFGEDGSGYTVMLGHENNWIRLTNLLYNVEYAFETLAFSEFGNKLEATPEQIEAWFNGSTDDNIFDWIDNTSGLSAYESSAVDMKFSSDDYSINLLRSIIELHYMCEFLEIGQGDWSPVIDTYLRIYDSHEKFFQQLEKNPHIYQKADTGKMSVEEPLGMFFNLQEGKVTDQWAKGFALSSLYVPMETNLYDANSVAFVNDPGWISDFYYKYAFYRKALYINTDNSVLVNQFVSGSTTSGKRVATLNDLLNYDRDIVLTIDDNFYNANEINDVISKLDYTGMRNTVGSPDTAEGWDAVEGWVGDMFDLNAANVLKTGDYSYYSSSLADNVIKFGRENDPLDLTANIVDGYVLSQKEILGDANGEGSVLNEYEYSTKQSYGVVSAVYRSPELYNECLKAIASDNAIFKSSKAIASTPGTTSSDWRSIYNYYMLANLDEQMKNDTASTLDLDAPIFCDLFGNIVTESGLVIIPAAANATLCGKNWNPYTVGWSEYYNNGNRIPVDEFSDEVYTWLIGRTFETSNKQDGNGIATNEESKKVNAGGFFEVDSTGVLVLRTTSLTSNNISAIVQWNSLNKNSTIIKQLFFNDAYFNKAIKLYDYRICHLVVETLRGAPIEYIDYAFEGLSGNQDISKYGVFMAYKFEEILNAMMPITNGENTGGNSIVTMANLAFIPGIEVIMLYVFKVIFAVLIVALVVQLYMDAVKNSLGFKSVGKFIVTCVMVIVAFTLLPTLVSWSYYKSNKDLLHEEAGYIMMLNYVKEFDGSEIGITNVTTPETQTELYIKLDDVSIDWWTIIDDVLFKNTYNSVTDLYEEQAFDNPLYGQKDVQVKGDGMYIDVQDVYDSTDIVYKPISNMLMNNMYVYDYNYNNPDSTQEILTTNSAMSFTSPYYVILDQLIANINEYNTSRDITAYSWSVGSNGHIMTYDVISPYLLSDEFLDEGFDILGMNRILKTGNNTPLYNFAYNDYELNRMELSLWYPTEMSESIKQEKIEELYDYTRDYIADNAEILGKIPDEVFLKVMAMQIAIKYNQLFNIPFAQSIELMNVDSRDLMRFMVGDNESIYKYFSYSFARFTYEEAGGIGIILSSFLTVVLWLTGFIKPLFMILILGLLIINVVFRKLLFKKDSKCIEGYLIGSACLVCANYAYSIMLKVTMSINSLGFGSVLSLLLGLLTQIVYIVVLVLIMVIEVKDWKNSGFNEFVAIGSNITSGLLKARSLVADKIISRTNEAYKDTHQSRRYSNDKYDRQSVQNMLDRDAEREERGTFSTN